MQCFVQSHSCSYQQPVAKKTFFRKKRIGAKYNSIPNDDNASPLSTTDADGADVEGRTGDEQLSLSTQVVLGDQKKTLEDLDVEQGLNCLDDDGATPTEEALSAGAKTSLKLAPPLKNAASITEEEEQSCNDDENDCAICISGYGKCSRCANQRIR